MLVGGEKRLAGGEKRLVGGEKRLVGGFRRLKRVSGLILTIPTNL